MSWAGFSSGDVTGENLLPSLLELLAAPALVAVGLRTLSYCWEPCSAARGHTLPCHAVISHHGSLLFQSHMERLFHQSAKLPELPANIHHLRTYCNPAKGVTSEPLASSIGCKQDTGAPALRGRGVTWGLP